ncbi:hypothetical protein GCM10009771_12600 [Nesterenkonia flava]
MLQHLLIGMYAPLLLLLGAPVTVVLGAASTTWRARLGRVLKSTGLHLVSHPATAAALHIGPLFLLYLTPVYTLMMTSWAWHVIFMVHFVLAGTLFAWSIAGPDPAPRRPGVVTRAAVLVLSGGLHAWLATLIYSRAESLPTAAHHGADGAAGAEELRSAAQLMYYGGDGAEILLAIALFAGWYRSRTRGPIRRREAGRRLSPSGR